jgi:hypothetical protein
MNLDWLILILFIMTGIVFGIFIEHHHEKTYYNCTVVETNKKLPLLSRYDLIQLEKLYAQEFNQSLVCEDTKLTAHQKRIYNSTLTIEAK